MAVWKLIRVINKGVTASPGGINNLLVKVPSGELIFKSPEVVHTPAPPLSDVEIKVDGAAASTIIENEPWYRYNQDEALSSQRFSLVIQKVCFDPVSFSEALLKHIRPLLIDTPKATDDFLGVANTDDDQTASVAKVLSETMNVGELVEVSWSTPRQYQDSLNKTDASWRHPNKGVTDAVGSATSIPTFIIDPTWADLLLPVEAVTLDFAKPLEDYFTLSETRSNGVNKVVAADAATSSERLIFICGRSIVDLRSLVDLYSVLIAKVLADTVSDSEAVSRNASKVSADTASSSDSGQLIQHTYAPTDYFADVYVGTISNF